MSDAQRKAHRKKKKEDNHFDGRFWEKVEQKSDNFLSEEEAIARGLEEYFALQKKEQTDEEKEKEKKTYEEEPQFNPFREKLK